MKYKSNTFLYLLSWPGSLFQLLFITLGIAAALYYLAEIIEEYSTKSRRYVRYLLIFSVVCNIALIIDGMPYLIIINGVLLHMCYYACIKHFPYVVFTDPLFILGTVLLVLQHYLAYNYFLEYFCPFSEILAYFTFCLWLTPFTFFISATTTDTSLPLTGHQTMDSLQDIDLTNNNSMSKRKPRSNFLGIFYYLLEQKNELLYGGRNKVF
ncbi:hypothetical protein LOD99_10328 [Oopsacas minuta]|uniref:Protein TEX261 n=1 Tax=Oopsacas minuta TaxID=111878 RepID=A0AAV7KL62_9METZ|nr:hypothetical protein LOD99_10328 [Oopsacas minuta]